MDNFAVVDFYTEQTEGNKLSVDVVCKSWMKFVDGEWSCLWPPEKHAENLDEWLESGKIPESDWTTETEFEVLGWAPTFRDAMRMLNKSYKRRDHLASADSSDANRRSAILKLSRNKAKQILRGNDENSTESEGDTQVKQKDRTSSLKMKTQTRRIESDESSDDNSGPIKSSTQQNNAAKNESSTQDTSNQFSSSKKKDSQNYSRKTHHQRPHGQESIGADDIDMNLNSNNNNLPTSGKKKDKNSYIGSENVANDIDCLLQLRKQISDRDLGLVVDYLDKKIDIALRVNLNHQLNNKRCLSYDFMKKFEAQNLKMVMDVQETTKAGWNPRKILNTSFPIKTLGEFLAFESGLDPNKNQNVEDENEKALALEKQDALKTLFLVTTTSVKEYQKCIHAIIGFLIHKNVQLLYSAAGRITKGVGKRAFNKTISYKCMEEVLVQKFPGIQKSILTKASEYLTAAPGRKAVDEADEA